MRFLLLITISFFIFFQYKLWFDDDGWRNMVNYEEKWHAQQRANQQLAAENTVLAAEVAGLLHAEDALEERARAQAGYIGENEIFYRIVD